MAKARKSVEELYKAIFAIRDALQDAQQLAAEAAVMSDAFGGEIARVITAQINTYFIPGISKFIDDKETPGAMSPLITFLDSVPLAMTRGEPEPQQVTPAPVANAQLAEPTGAAQPAAGSYAAKTKESRQREKTTAEVTAKHEFIKGLLTPEQAAQALYDDGYNMERAKQLVKQWQAEDESLYESRAKMTEGLFGRVTKVASLMPLGADISRMIGGTPEEAIIPMRIYIKARRAGADHMTAMDTLERELQIPPSSKISQAVAFIANKHRDKLLPFYNPETPFPEARARNAPATRECYQIIRKGKKDEQVVATVAEKEEADCRAKTLNGTITPTERDFFGTEYIVRAFKKPEGQKDVSQAKALPTPKKLPESNENRGMTAGELAAAESEERKVSRDPNFDPDYSAENKKKESLSLKDIPIDDYSVQDAYDELMQGGEVEDDLAPDYIAQNMFGAEPGSPRYQQVADKLAGMKRAPVVEESLEMGDLGGPDLSLMASKVQGLIEDGFSEEDALDYVADTEEVDRDQLKDACGIQ